MATYSYSTSIPPNRQSDNLKSSLELHLYTLATPGGHWLKVTANAAAIAPPLKCGWTVVDVREAQS